MPHESGRPAREWGRHVFATSSQLIDDVIMTGPLSYCNARNLKRVDPRILFMVNLHLPTTPTSPHRQALSAHPVMMNTTQLQYLRRHETHLTDFTSKRTGTIQRCAWSHKLRWFKSLILCGAKLLQIWYSSLWYLTWNTTLTPP
jgi:hypothetical protein